MKRRFGGLALPVSALLCGALHAGNNQTKHTDPLQEISAVRYDTANGAPQLRTDFTDNRDFEERLLKAYERAAEFKNDLSGHVDWRPAAEAYHLAFEELKKRLQGEWRRIFGDGPSRFPWNGHSDGATDLWREDDLRRDMPVVLSFWAKEHICPTSVSWSYCNPWGVTIPNDNKAYVPASCEQSVINKGKETYGKYVLKFFNVRKLSECAAYLQKFFCEPVARLLREVAPMLEKSTDKGDLLRLLNLYSDYYQLDAVWNRIQTFFVETTRRTVHLVIACYLNYDRWAPEDQKWLCSLIDRLEANYYGTETLHAYCIQSYDLALGENACREHRRSGKVFDKGLTGIWRKLKNTPLPKLPWLKFLNYAGKRYSLGIEDAKMAEGYGITSFNRVLHKSETFDAVPCAGREGDYFRKIIALFEEHGEFLEEELKEEAELDRLEEEVKADEERACLEEAYKDLKNRKALFNYNYTIFREKERRTKEKTAKELKILKKESDELKIAADGHKISEEEKQKRREAVLKKLEILKQRLDDLDAERAGFERKGEEIKKETADLEKRSEELIP